MKKTTVLLSAITFWALCSSVDAMYSVIDKGTWPKSWAVELEPLRKQSRTLVGPMIPQLHYEIPFTKRQDFESAWPQLLKVKSKGAPIILLRSPDKWLGANIKSGVRVHSPPEQTNKQINPEVPLAGPAVTGRGNVRERWMWTTYIELIVDGDVVDLNRIPLPADTPIIDERFHEEEQRKTPKPSQ
ncbi:MAG TPA: hypothetical protein VGJ26_21955 [Pirellulales bacterium]|jgi:hypothetical protein